MAEIVKLCEADDPRDVIHRVVPRLVEGQLVELPTQSGPAVAAYALHPEAITRLQALARSREPSRRQDQGGELLLALKGVEEAKDYVTGFSQTGERLARRIWPGPLILALPVPTNQGLLRELPEVAQKALLRPRHGDSAEVWIRVPAHPAVYSILSLLPAPLLLWEDRNFAEGKQTPTDVDLIIEDAPRHNLGKSTIVRVDQHSWTLLEPGLVTETQLNRMAGKVVLFVCTGNTCRSPLAESLFRKTLADHLDCAEDELPERGYTILSAGLAAARGAPAAAESVEVARQYGADLESHSSQPLTDELLSQADHVFTMTHSHRDSILFARPDAVDRVVLLSVEEADISDPIGGSQEEYEACGQEIARHLKAVLQQLAPADFPPSSNPES